MGAKVEQLNFASNWIRRADGDAEQGLFAPSCNIKYLFCKQWFKRNLFNYPQQLKN